MSLVAEILSSRGKLEFEDVSSKLVAVQEAVDFSVEQARALLSNKYKHFRLQQDTNHKALIDLQKLATTMEELRTRIEVQTKTDIQKTSGELKTLSDGLRKVTIKAECVREVLELDEKLTGVTELLAAQRFHSAAQITTKMLQSLKQTQSLEPEVSRAVKAQAILTHEQLLYELGNVWKASVVCQQVEEGSIQLKVVQQPLPELLAALNLIGNDHRVRTLADRLMDLPLTTVMLKTVDSKNDNPQEVMFFNVREEQPLVEDVVDRLGFIFEVLNAPDEIEGESLLKQIGAEISDQFCEMFIKDVLQKSVPVTAADKTNFVQNVSQKIADMHQFLESSGFLGPNQRSILDYVQNIDLHFINKSCERYLQLARDIICKDLHNTLELKIEEGNNFMDVDEDNSFSSLSSATTKFPKCSVSVAVKELLDLVWEMLNESANSAGMKAERLYLTARNVVEMYCTLAPIHHKKYLDSLPQQAAIYHNNCMYLAHQMMLQGPHYSGILSKNLQLQSITFFDLVVKLRKTGCQIFIEQMQVQRKQLVELLKDSQLTLVGESDHLPSKTEKCVRQCLRQLEVLQHVCQPILPEEIYNKAIGTLINSMVEELIVRISSVEDIPANAASDLVTVCSVVMDKAPRMLSESNKIHQYVKRWRAFEEFLHILGGNLATIEARWAQRAGPLAQEFSAAQVKQLIKALFQNTARRAAVLASIE